MTVTTPMGSADAAHVADKVAIIPILRAGLGMSDAMLELMPNAAVHHIGMYRLKGSQMPVQYYNRLPRGCAADVAFVLDPLIASGTTICATVSQLKKWGCPKVVVCAILATSEGLANIEKEHPDVEVYCAEAGDSLGDDGMMHPGVGDAGDRQFGFGVGAEEHAAAAAAAAAKVSKKRASGGSGSPKSKAKKKEEFLTKLS